MSIHEVAMDKEENLAYLSWYDAGMRVVRLGANGITEVGTSRRAATTSGASRCTGFRAIRRRRTLLGSDRDCGLWIFRYTGP